MRHIDTPHDAEHLAHEVLQRRPRPLVVVSTDDAGEFRFDPHYIERELAGVAEVVTIRTGSVSYRMQDDLPDKAQVFGGAARAYPPTFGEDPRWQRSPLRFPGQHANEDLIQDALEQAGGGAGASAREPDRAWATATVAHVGDSSTGTIATLPGGGIVAINVDLLDPGVSLADAVARGDEVHGWLVDRDLSPEPAAPDLSRFTDGDVTRARVTKTTDRRAYVSLHPAADDIILRRRHVFGEGVESAVDDVLLPGDVVALRVARDERGSLELHLPGVTADDPRVPSLPLIEGGSPWLREDVRVPRPEEHDDGFVADEPADPITPPHGIPAAGETAVLDRLGALSRDVAQMSAAITRLSRGEAAKSGAVPPSAVAEIERLKADLNECRSARERLRGQITELQAGRRRAEQAATRASGPAETPAVRRSRWPDAESWVRHEILLAWVERVDASEKHRFPLREYAISSAFAGSLDMLDEAQLAKAMRAAVDALTGRAAEVAGRDQHRLRTGWGGDDPYVVRDDGAKSWRVAIELNTASARRLHYWELPGGSVELSRVVLHDDTTP